MTVHAPFDVGDRASMTRVGKISLRAFDWGIDQSDAGESIFDQNVNRPFHHVDPTKGN